MALDPNQYVGAYKVIPGNAPAGETLGEIYLEADGGGTPFVPHDLTTVIPDLDPATATTAQISTAVNQILAALRAAGFTKAS